MEPCIDKTCGSHHPGWPGNCKAGRVEECGFYKPLMAEKDDGSKVPCSDGVIKQLFEEEIQRLEEDINFLNKKNSYESAAKARCKMLGVQGIWAKMRQKGIAL